MSSKKRQSKKSNKASKSAPLKMLQKLHKIILRWRDLYPVVAFSVIPALFFWTQSNIQELGLPLMWRTLFIAIGTGLVIFVFWYLMLKRDKFKASIISILTLFVALSYGQLFGAYETFLTVFFGAENDFSNHNLFITVSIFIFIRIFFFVRDKLNFSKNVQNYLAIFSTVLLVLNLYPLVSNSIANIGINNINYGPEIISAGSEEQPDIYYIVLDRYANEKVLEDVYDFDNTEFLDSLKDTGFYVASESIANYPFTTFSLASSLNLDYIPDEYKERSDSGVFYTLMKDKLENNKTALFLKDQGYSFVNIGPWWTATKYNKNADKDLYHPAGVVLAGNDVDLKKHELLMLQETIAWQLFSRDINVGSNDLFGLTFEGGKESSGRVIHRETIHHQLDTIKEISETRGEGSKFVFAHFLFPHDPYVLDENCDVFKSRYTDEYEVYINQLKCSNIKIKELVSYILENNETKPIIIIQSDEGPYPKAFRKDKTLDWNEASDELLLQKAGILNAYYFPDGEYSSLYQDITPVNTFRLIFDQYLGTNLGLTEDRHYFQESEKRRFFQIDMTDRLKKEINRK